MLDFSWFADPNAWAALITLTVLEIVLGIDNIVFLSILVDRLPVEKRRSGRIFGLGLAMITRLLLLATIKWMMSLGAVLFTVPIAPVFWKIASQAADNQGQLAVTGKGLILILGGLFLIWKATKEIHQNIDEGTGHQVSGSATNFIAVMIQIAAIDIIFSLDSVITAVGMADQLSVMATAVVISVGIMMLASGPISNFITRYPSIKMLALAFLMLIGTALVAQGLDFTIPKGYIYFAMAFSLGVELLNLRVHGKKAPDTEQLKP